MSDNAYINDLEERNAELRRELAEAKSHIVTSVYGFAPIDGNASLAIAVKSVCDERDSLRAQLTAANATIAACKEWTPASTPPSDSRFVLVWAPGYDVRLATYRPDIHEGYPWRSDTNHNCGVFFTPTHWKEVPPTPAASREAQ